MNLLVTGGAGFIGSNLLYFLIGKSEINILVNLDSLTYAGHLVNLRCLSHSPAYRFEKVDLRDKNGVARLVQEYAITHVMHLAAESHVDRSIAVPGDFIHTNIVGTFHLLEACREAWKGHFGGKRFHHISSDEVYGSLGSSGLFTETSPYAPNSPYSASKASSNLLVRAYHHTYGLPAVITNSSNNYGPFQLPEKLIPMTIRNTLLNRSIPIYGDGLNVRDWLFVLDHCEALWEVLIRGRDGETYNIGSQNEYTNLLVVESICDLMDGLAPERAKNSRRLITFVEDRLGHDRRYAIDASKIASELGWTPHYTFHSGIRETIKWYLSNEDWISEVTV